MRERNLTKTETLSEQNNIKKEIKRIEKLLKNKSVDDKVLKLNQGLIFQTAFMKLQLEKLAKDINENGVTEQYCNGANQFGIKKSASADVYGTMIKSYMTAQKQLNDCTVKQARILSYIDLILSSNLSAKFAQQQAGHSDIQTTLNVYARNNSDMVENAMQKLDEVFYEQKYEQNESKNRQQGKSNILSFPETRKNIG